MNIDVEIKFEIESYYSENELQDNGMKKLNNHELDYIVYEKESLVYFFEKIKIDLLRLYCVANRKSFYLS